MAERTSAQKQLAELQAAIDDHNAKIVAFNNSSGKITDVDQKSLTELVKSAAALKVMVDEVELPKASAASAPTGPKTAAALALLDGIAQLIVTHEANAAQHAVELAQANAIAAKVNPASA